MTRATNHNVTILRYDTFFVEIIVNNSQRAKYHNVEYVLERHDCISFDKTNTTL